MRDLSNLNVAKGFEKLPKVQQIAQCGHPALPTFSHISITVAHHISQHGTNRYNTNLHALSLVQGGWFTHTANVP